MKQRELNDATAGSLPRQEEGIAEFDGLAEEIARLARDLAALEMRPAVRRQRRPQHFIASQQVEPHAQEARSPELISHRGVAEGSIAAAGLAELHKWLDEFIERSK